MGWIVPSGVVVMTGSLELALEQATKAVRADIGRYEKSCGVPEHLRYSEDEVAEMSRPTSDIQFIPASWGYPDRFWIGMTRVLDHKSVGPRGGYERYGR